jgi:hypothetical protein
MASIRRSEATLAGPAGARNLTTGPGEGGAVLEPAGSSINDAAKATQMVLEQAEVRSAAGGHGAPLSSRSIAAARHAIYSQRPAL